MPHHAGVLLIDRMLDWLQPSSTRITILGVYGALNSSTWHKAGLQFTCCSHILIPNIHSWQVRIATAFYWRSKMKKCLNVAPVWGVAAQPGGQCAANITCAMSPLYSQSCIGEALRTTWRSHPFPLLKSESLAFKSHCFSTKTFTVVELG